MRKENVLVIVLIGIAVAAGVLYINKGGETVGFSQVTQEPQEVSAASGIAWENMEEGLARSTAENKPVLLYFQASWCTYCVKLKMTTFKDKGVLKLLDDNFVSISIDTDQNGDLARQWRVKGLPTMWFLKPGGSKIDRIPGYVNANQMVKILEFVHNRQYDQVSFHDFFQTL